MYQKHFAQRGPTPQTEAIPGRTDQVKNNAGGFVFAVDDWKRLDRFLVLGTEGGTYYVDEKTLTVENAKAVLKCIEADGARTVARIVEVSQAGRAPKNDPALFALALCAAAKDVNTRKLALAALPKVARIGTHLFHFAAFVNAQRGWGRSLKNAVQAWYTTRPVEDLALQLVKYQQRDGWSHRDLLRLGHTYTGDQARRAAFAWAVNPSRIEGSMIDTSPMTAGRKNGTEKVLPVRVMDQAPVELPPILAAYESLKRDPQAKTAVRLIREQSLPREAIPTELLNDVSVWDALLEDMPMTAMIRNLGKMSAVGLLKPASDAARHVAKRLGDRDVLRKARVHPFAILLAQKIYASGHGAKGKLSWSAVPQIVDALDDAFYAAFENVVPTGKRIMIGIDVSGSMTSPFMDSPLTMCEAAAAMAMVTARTERDYMIMGFNQGMQQVDISAKSRMDDVLKQTRSINGGGTDCSLPMTYSQAKGWKFDAFQVLTDNETWAGRIQPNQALQAYRNSTGINSKLVVTAFAATPFTIADPTDRGMLDIVGFSTDTPAVISDFIRDDA